VTSQQQDWYFLLLQLKANHTSIVPSSIAPHSRIPLELIMVFVFVFVINIVHGIYFEVSKL
jgi:hypothetical protein